MRGQVGPLSALGCEEGRRRCAGSTTLSRGRLRKQPGGSWDSGGAGAVMLLRAAGLEVMVRYLRRYRAVVLEEAARQVVGFGRRAERWRARVFGRRFRR